MKRLPDPVQKINAWVLGLDLHKNLTVWVLLDRKGHRVGEGQIQSSPGALEALYRQVIGRKKAHVAFEAGGSSIWAFDTCLELLKDEERIHVAHPKSVKAIANSKQKNDLNDAWWLAYLTFEQRLPEVWLPRGRYRDLRVATRERTAFVRERTRTIKRIHAHMRQVGKALPKGALHNGGECAALRATLAGLSDVRRMAIEQDLEHMASLSSRILIWEKKIEELASDWDEVQVLKASIPGVGMTLAATITAESGPITRFYSAKAYGRYTGLSPSERSSAGQTRFGGISREGNSELRWALSQAVTACMRTRRGPGVAVGNWVRAREGRMGSRKKAKVAAARKLAEAIWRLFELGECFDLERVFGRVPLEARLRA
jgi:transposase